MSMLGRFKLTPGTAGLRDKLDNFRNTIPTAVHVSIVTLFNGAARWNRKLKIRDDGWNSIIIRISAYTHQFDCLHHIYMLSLQMSLKRYLLNYLHYLHTFPTVIQRWEVRQHEKTNGNSVLRLFKYKMAAIDRICELEAVSLLVDMEPHKHKYNR